MEYIESNDNQYQVFFPDHFCGPDIIFKEGNVIHILQVKFVEKISKQKRANACNTTDPQYFYWNKSKKCVLNGFAKKREKILTVLNQIPYKRHVFLHTNTQTSTGMENVHLINQLTSPRFFDALDTKEIEIWALLNKIRENFSSH
jgi:hypothetical protein